MSDQRHYQRLSNTGQFISPLPPSQRPSIVSMGQSNRTSSQESVSDGIRKRVCKACDRCRLKKSKCDGASPCSRCRADDTICEFGERKKSQDKIYPKGYVEMLEGQQTQLVAGLREMYRRARQKSAWESDALNEGNDGNPLTHDILVALNIVNPRQNEQFEENTEKIQADLLAKGAELARRRSSLSSASDHSQNGHSRMTSMHKLQVQSKPSVIKQEPNVKSAASSPFVQSPVQPSMRQQNSNTANRNQFPFGEPMSATSPAEFDDTWPEYDNDYSMLGSESLAQGFPMSDFDGNMPRGGAQPYNWTSQPQWQAFGGPVSMGPGYQNDMPMNQWSGDGNFVNMQDMYTFPQQHASAG